MTVRNLLDLSSGLEPESELLGRLGDVGVGEWRARKETRREVPAR
jgi:CubicO group peptidase (beta-lactamase class C family)